MAACISRCCLVHRVLLYSTIAAWRPSVSTVRPCCINIVSRSLQSRGLDVSSLAGRLNTYATFSHLCVDPLDRFEGLLTGVPSQTLWQRSHRGFTLIFQARRDMLDRSCPMW